MTAPAAASASTAGLLTLRAGPTVVTLDPAAGGRITRLRLAGRDWLGAAGLADHVTVGADPADAVSAGVTTRTGDASAVTRVDDGARPYAFERTVALQPDGTVRVDYALTSRADAPLPLDWSARPALPLVPGTRLDLPVAARVRVLAERDVALGGAGALHRWPVLRVGGRDATRFGPREVDFTFPALAPRRFGDDGRGAYGCALLLELPRPAGNVVRVGVEQDGARLEFAVDPAAVPGARLEVDATAAAGSEVAAEASAAAGTIALGPAAAAVTVAPGETRRWSVLWRGRAAPAGA